MPEKVIIVTNEAGKFVIKVTDFPSLPEAPVQLETGFDRAGWTTHNHPPAVTAIVTVTKRMQTDFIIFTVPARNDNYFLASQGHMVIYLFICDNKLCFFSVHNAQWII